jgi:hypothetical protein
MITAKARLESTSVYSQSRHYADSVAKLEKESHADYETRTWRNRCHTTKEGYIFIPPSAFKNCIAEAARFLGEKIQGKGNATYTKHFESGVMVIDPLVLPIKADDVPCETLFVPADGKRGSGKRVTKCFPAIPKWSGDVEFIIVDPTITKDVFERHLKEAGSLIGIGRFRPRNNGYYGRFIVKSLTWTRRDSG